MTFTSTVFLVFFAIVYAAYLCLARRHRLQNYLLLVASYVFYGYWDWRFLALLIGTSYLDYLIGKKISEASDDRRKRWLLKISLIANLGVLGFFKYFNFFLENVLSGLHALGLEANPRVMEILLPVGISFYTFQSMSYTIDVYRGHIPAVARFSDFATYVAFFPQLVAGPIERASTLIPAILAPRIIRSEQVNAGLFLIALGYFKKVVVADNLAPIANTIFENPASYTGFDLVLGALAFTFQIYGDFSGYSDIARGLAKLMGFELMINFRLPYFATSPSDFWNRWHISLSTWLRDYLYIPLGGNKRTPWFTYRNLMVTMLLGGLWHGAAWHFVVWGLYHGVLLCAYRLFASINDDEGSPAWKSGRTAFRMALMFFFTVVGWVIFRARSLGEITHFITQAGMGWSPHTTGFARDVAFFVLPLLGLELVQHRTEDMLFMLRLRLIARAAILFALVLWILVFGVRQPMSFIYFQF